MKPSDERRAALILFKEKEVTINRAAEDAFAIDMFISRHLKIHRPAP